MSRPGMEGGLEQLGRGFPGHAEALYGAVGAELPGHTEAMFGAVGAFDTRGMTVRGFDTRGTVRGFDTRGTVRGFDTRGCLPSDPVTAGDLANIEDIPDIHPLSNVYGEPEFGVIGTKAGPAQQFPTFAVLMQFQPASKQWIRVSAKQGQLTQPAIDALVNGVVPVFAQAGAANVPGPSGPFFWAGFFVLRDGRWQLARQDHNWGVAA